MSESHNITAKGQRTAATPNVIWEEGKYVLLIGRYTPVGQEGGVELVRGDDVVLEQEEATRLGNTGSIAPVASAAAEEAKATPGTRSEDERTDSPATREGGSGA